jgi:hypothetical protein
MNDTRDLTNRLAELLRREHGALADFLIALAEFDRERRWLELGYTSLFYFLHRELGLPKGSAFYRKTAAELIQRYPEVIEPLRDGRLCITGVVELAKVITPENRGEVVRRFFHASRAEAKAISAELRPLEAAPHRDVVTVLPSTLTHSVLPEPFDSGRLAASAQDRLREEESKGLAWIQAAPVVPPPQPRGEAQTCAATLPSVPSPVKPDQAEPLTADLRRLHVTVSRRFVEKLAAARDALSHSHPGAGSEVVLEAALDLLLAAHERKRGLVKKPRPAPPRPTTSPRHVPADVKRAVWARDGGCCQWPMASGGVCGSTTRLELDHIVPVARGGASTMSNIRVLCAVHNQLAARRMFGDAWMDRFVAKAAKSG